MIFKRFFNGQLAQASFLVGCGKSKKALIVDPNRSLDRYLEAAADEGLRIVAVAETHIHADFASGAVELADRTGAKLYVSGEGGPDWLYEFRGDEHVQELRHGETFAVGTVQVEAIHTPGHTPEHLTYLITDAESGDTPYAALTGDFIFAGDVGRPDLLERAANVKGAMQEGAEQLFESIQGFVQLPDHLLLWPGHGEGSSCGKNLGGIPATSLGYEREANWALKSKDKDRFVKEILEGQPDPPPYFREMKILNRSGVPSSAMEFPSRLTFALFEKSIDKSVMVDIRSEEEFAAGYIPGTLHLPFGSSFLKWAGWLLPYEGTIHMIASDHEDVRKAVESLRLIGLDRVTGWYGPDLFDAIRQRGGHLETVRQVKATDVDRLLQSNQIHLLDVRSESERDSGKIEGSLHHPLTDLAKGKNRMPTGKPLVVHCGSGTRASIAISLLARSGMRNLGNLAGGFSAYDRATSESNG